MIWATAVYRSDDTGEEFTEPALLTSSPREGKPVAWDFQGGRVRRCTAWSNFLRIEP